MKKIILILFFLASAASLFAQGTGWRIRLLKNINNYANHDESSYSACWGYTAPNGREYAILGCWDGTAFVDITDTNNIREVDFVPCPNISDPGNNWREMKTYSHYAYVVSEAENSNIQIIDLQYLPDSVRYVGKFNLPGHSKTHSISQSGPYLYLNGSNSSFGRGFAILDLTVNPEVPVLRGKWNTRYVHDCRVINDTVWTANINDDYVTIVNVANKDNPVTITSWLHNPQPNAPHNIALSNDRRYAFITDETFSPSAGRLKIWNVTDIFNPIYITSFNPGPFGTADAHNAEIYNNYIFLAHYTAGVKVIDVSNPSNPLELGWYDTYPDNNGAFYDGCWGVYYFPNSNKIIASDQKRGLFVLRPDLTPPVGIENISDIIPDEYNLYQNYPNPFNPETNIKFDLPKSGYVNLILYSITGKEISKLVNENLQAGVYNYKLNASHLNSGVYFVRLISSDFAQTQKIVLLK